MLRDDRLAELRYALGHFFYKFASKPSGWHVCATRRTFQKSHIFSILLKTAPGSNLTRTVIFRHTVNYRRSDDHVRRPQGVVGQLISVVGVKGRLQLSSLKPSPGTPGGPVYSIFSFFRDVRDSAGTFWNVRVAFDGWWGMWGSIDCPAPLLRCVSMETATLLWGTTAKRRHHDRLRRTQTRLISLYGLARGLTAVIHSFHVLWWWQDSPRPCSSDAISRKRWPGWSIPAEISHPKNDHANTAVHKFLTAHVLFLMFFFW